MNVCAGKRSFFSAVKAYAQGQVVVNTAHQRFEAVTPGLYLHALAIEQGTRAVFGKVRLFEYTIIALHKGVYRTGDKMGAQVVCIDRSVCYGSRNTICAWVESAFGLQDVDADADDRI